jgi:chlorophyllase
MKSSVTIGLALLVVTSSVASGCGSSDSVPADPGVTDDGGSPLGDGGARDAAQGDAAKGDGASGDGATPGDGGLADPAADGPFAIAEKDATATIASTTDKVAVHVAYPTAAGPFPVVVVAHGFQLPPTQYYGYVKRLASFGYVALTVDFPTSLTGNDNPRQAKDLVGGIDWAKADATVGPKVDATKAGMSGHSLGGKLALLAATLDPRVKAAFVLDPVDSGGPSGCNAPSCVVVKDLMPTLAVPTGFLGETTDASGGFQSCAPAADNFTKFYEKAKTPSLQITALGANHMSFLDDVSTCGFTCSFCNAATATNAQVNGMARALMVAFYERHLRGNTAYDTYLTGADATARYVTTSQATIVSK